MKLVGKLADNVGKAKDGGKHFFADIIPDSVPFRLQILCDAAFGHQIFVNPWILQVLTLLINSFVYRNRLIIVS